MSAMRLQKSEAHWMSLIAKRPRRKKTSAILSQLRLIGKKDAPLPPSVDRPSHRHTSEFGDAERRAEADRQRVAAIAAGAFNIEWCLSCGSRHNLQGFSVLDDRIHFGTLCRPCADCSRTTEEHSALSNSMTAGHKRAAGRCLDVQYHGQYGDPQDQDNIEDAWQEACPA